MSNHKNSSLEDFRRELEEDIANHTAKVEQTPRQSSTKTNPPSKERNVPHHSQSTHHSSSYSSASHKSHSSKRRNKKKKTPLKVVSFILVALLIIGAAGYGFVQWELNRISRHTTNEVTQEEVKGHLDAEDKYGVGSSDTVIINDPNITNILLIGQDRKKDQKAEMRSDAMIVCSMNSKTKEIRLCSLMRDMYVPVPGYGYGMLNHTYMIGGYDLLKETIESNFGIPIDGYLEVDFTRFMELIDLLGGVNVNITLEEANHLNNKYNKGWHLTEGNNLLNSEQALYYCRIRQNIGGDWGRTDRQRKVIMSAFNQLKSSGPSAMLSFTHAALPLLTTSLTNTKIIKYAYAIASYKMNAEKSYRLPVEGTYTQEVKEDTLHVLVPDLKKNSAAIKNYLYK